MCICVCICIYIYIHISLSLSLSLYIHTYKHHRPNSLRVAQHVLLIALHVPHDEVVLPRAAVNGSVRTGWKVEEGRQLRAKFEMKCGFVLCSWGEDCDLGNCRQVHLFTRTAAICNICVLPSTSYLEFPPERVRSFLELRRNSKVRVKHILSHKGWNS